MKGPRNPNAPFLWLALLLISTSVGALEANYTDVPHDAQLLLAIKRTYSYLSLEDWVEPSITNFCNWTGVTCDAQNRRNVVALNLQNRSLSGSIPPELGDLHHLISLNLSYNSFRGSIPPPLFGEPNSSLSILSLAHNQISGILPTNLFNSSAFQYLDISYNNLGGFIPPRLGLLSNLHHLNLCQNNFVGPIPLALSNNTKLTVLDLCLNLLLNGTIPPELGLLSRLDYLCLGFNDFTGTIPTSIPSNCTQLRSFAIGNNRMSGAIPEEFGKLRYLERLFIENANFQGQMPSAFGNVTTLRLFAVFRNSLTGRIPISLGQLSNVDDFLISANFFTGSLPPQFGNLTNVQYLNVRRNLLTGSIPSDYGRLKSVTRFFAFDNDLSGGIPAELGNCSSLAQIWLSRNRLSGRIPEELGRGLTQLASLSVDHNDLSGTIPESLSNCTKLQDLNLGYNRLRGNIPPALANLRQIVKSFSMPRNLLEGNIPAEIGGMMLVTNIDLAGNLLSGHIPGTMASCVEVLHLNLSGNRLEGQVPLWFRSMITLTDLNLSDNHLSGSIPPYLGDMETLRSLNVSYNRLSGPIPNNGVFRNLTAASFLGNEGLCGPILGIACAAASGPSSSPRLNKGKKLAIIFSALAFVGFTAAASVFCFIRARAKSKKENAMHLAFTKYSAGISEKANRIKSMSTTELFEATGGFNPQNIVGSGKTATVYRGCLPDGLEVAIKRFKEDTCMESLHSNLIAELRVLGMTRHRNLVRLLGYCNSPGMVSLVMEMMPNGTLARHIEEKILDWETVVSIAVGVANGLLYLHKEGLEPILHCDLKPSNILLDFDLKPAIADFGLSRILKYADMSDGFSTSNIRGSIGYMAPEYAAGSRITSKVDVYSFGIVLLEMVSGRSPTCEMFLDGRGTMTLRQWVVDSIADNNPLRAVAPQFFEGSASGEYSIKDEMIKVLSLGLACSSYTSQNRPSMKEVVRNLSTLYSIAVPKRKHSISPDLITSSSH